MIAMGGQLGGWTIQRQISEKRIFETQISEKRIFETHVAVLSPVQAREHYQEGADPGMPIHGSNRFWVFVF